MAVFPVTIEQDENGVFVVECPSLPGCVSQGATEAEALDRIREAIQGWLLVEQDKRTAEAHARVVQVAV